MPRRKESPGRQAGAESKKAVQVTSSYPAEPPAVKPTCAHCVYSRQIQRPRRSVCGFWGERTTAGGGCRFWKSKGGEL
jgi:hypothetical protein